jgi:hypothetical protein
MKQFDIVPFKIGKDNCPFVWSQSYTILTHCEHYPERKVGGEKYCQKCKHFVGLIDNGNSDLSVKCTHNYTKIYRLKQWFNKLY